MRVVGHAKLVTTDTNGSSAIVTRQILVALGINLSNLSLFSAFYRLTKNSELQIKNFCSNAEAVLGLRNQEDSPRRRIQSNV